MSPDSKFSLVTGVIYCVKRQTVPQSHSCNRCTIRLVEHFLTHSWLPPSSYDSEAQGEKKVSKFRALFSLSFPVWVCVCIQILYSNVALLWLF